MRDVFADVLRPFLLSKSGLRWPSLGAVPVQAQDGGVVSRLTAAIGVGDRADQEWRTARTEISVEELRTRLADFVTTMQGVINSLPQDTGDFPLTEMTFSAEGTVSLLGSGVPRSPMWMSSCLTSPAPSRSSLPWHQDTRSPQDRRTCPAGLGSAGSGPSWPWPWLCGCAARVRGVFIPVGTSSAQSP
ncbi:Pepco domain-containing protein [Streptomyces collinus]